MFLDKYNSGSLQRLVSDITCIVMYCEERINKLPRIPMAVFDAKYTDHLILSTDTKATIKNAAIGRRICPLCYVSGKKEAVNERGDDAGRCTACKSYVDYLTTAFKPYFFYYSAANDRSMHVGKNTWIYTVAETLKDTLINGKLRDLMLPTDCSNGIVNMNVPAYLNAQVFDCYGIQGRRGWFGNTEYNFNVDMH